MQQQKILNSEQSKILAELCAAHELEPEQISFHENETTPIFNYEAINYLSLKLTDIQDIKTQIVMRDDVSAKASCRVELEDGRTRSIEETAYLGEPIGGDSTIDTLRLAEQVAQSRAARKGIRSVGINLFAAHKKFMETGEIAESHTRHDPRYADYQEIKVLAKKLGLITIEEKNGKMVENKDKYQILLQKNFDVISQTELDDVKLHRFKVLLRSLDRIGRATVIKQAA